MTLALGVLVSGSGSNLQAILDAIDSGQLDAECKVVISNKAQAYALERAAKRGVPTAVIEHKDFDTREAFDEQLVSTLQEAGVQWIALAGFMRVLTDVFLKAFPGKIVNIHPALLPAFPGVNAQEQAFDYGVKIAGCTVHFVDGGVDSGPIIQQAQVPVLDDDTADSVRARILKEEHRIFPESLSLIAQGRVELQSREGRRPRVVILPPEPTR